MGLLFLKTSPLKQYSYENYFSGIFDALQQSFLVNLLVYLLYLVAVSDGEASLHSLQDAIDVLEESVQHIEPSSVQSTPRSVRSQASTLKGLVF